VIALDSRLTSLGRGCPAEDVGNRVDHIDVLMNNAGSNAIPLRRTATRRLRDAVRRTPRPTFAPSTPPPPPPLPRRIAPAVCSAADSPEGVVRTSSQAHRIAPRCAATTLNGRKRYSKWGAATGNRSWRTCLSRLRCLDGRERRRNARGVAAPAHHGATRSTPTSRRPWPRDDGELAVMTAHDWISEQPVGSQMQRARVSQPVRGPAERAGND